VTAYEENAIQTPHRNEPLQHQFRADSDPPTQQIIKQIGVAGADSITTNQSYQSRQHSTQASEEKYGLNDDHLHRKSDSRNSHSHGNLSEETESRAIGTLQRLQDPHTHHSHPNVGHTQASRPPIRPATNDTSTSGINKRSSNLQSQPSASTNTSRSTARNIGSVSATTRVNPPQRTGTIGSSSNSSDTVLLKYVADRAHASPHPVSAHKAVASAYIDAGYYQYEFDALDTPLVTLDERSVQSNGTNDSMRYSIEQGSVTNNNHQDTTPEYNRLVSDRNNSHNAVDSSMNYGVISNMNRASMGAASDIQTDSVSLLAKDMYIQNRRIPSQDTTNPSYPVTNITSASSASNSGVVNKSRSKSPHFMRPTTSHAFKAASNRPVEAKVGVEYR